MHLNVAHATHCLLNYISTVTFPYPIFKIFQNMVLNMWIIKVCQLGIIMNNSADSHTVIFIQFDTSSAHDHCAVICYCTAQPSLSTWNLYIPLGYSKTALASSVCLLQNNSIVVWCSSICPKLKWILLNIIYNSWLIRW